MASHLIYQPLNNALHEIRLLEIESSGTQSGEIICNLTIVSLLDRPEFVALSYVWGNKDVTEDISLNGFGIPVTTNLAAALRQVRGVWEHIYPHRQSRSFRLWADAICINQDDISERNKQIELMKSIYTDAEIVLAWLGVGDSKMEVALETYDVLFQLTRNLKDNELISLQWLRGHPSLFNADVEEIRNETWDAVGSLWNLPYWTRAWIFQEVTLSRKLLLIYGSKHLDFERASSVGTKLKTLMDKHGENHGGRPAFLPKAVWRAISNPDVDYKEISQIEVARAWVLRKERADWTDMWLLSTIARSLKATDPKDYIYGLLAVTQLRIRPDYSDEKCLSDVYIEYVTEWLREWSAYQFMGINSARVSQEWFGTELFFLHLSGIGGFENILKLPSWAPNYPELSQRGMMGTPFKNVGNADPKVFKQIQSQCRVKGSSIWVTAACITPINRLSDILKSKIWHSRLMITYFQEFISRYPTYVTGIPPLQAIYRVIFEDRTSQADDLTILRALGFLLLVLWPPNLEINRFDRFKLLGLQSDELFASSFEEKFFPGCGFISRNLPNPSAPANNSTEILEDTTRPVLRQIMGLEGCRFFETRAGYLGLTTQGAKQGDIVCVLKGCNVPVLLRRAGSHYVHVSTCFVLGLMEGEAAELLEKGEVELRRVEIR